MSIYRYHLMASFDRELPQIRSNVFEEKNVVNVEIPFLTSTGDFRYGLQKTINNLKKMNFYPSESGFDVIIIGLMVYIADMKISRVKQSQDSWTREISLKIPVYDEHWSEFTSTFERMLSFLTGDRWEIEFVKRKMKFSEKECIDGISMKYKIATLFSGGMDSLIGSIDLMEKKRPTLLISHAGESIVRTSQKKLISIMDKLYPDVPHENAYLWTDLSDIEFPNADGDMNQRSRSFLFIAIGIFAMSGCNECKTLLMPENGLIALNVPLDYLRSGAHSTRTTHPFYLKLWNRIVESVFGFTIENPFWNKTKGEMACECLNKDVFLMAIGQSFSCSSINSARIRSGKTQHCGHCLPCIVRRAAMYRAFKDYDPSEYMYSNVSKLVDDRGDIGGQIRSFQYAIDRLKKNPRAKNILIHIPGPLEEDNKYLDELADTYCRGLMEVDQWIQDSIKQEMMKKEKVK